ncbi:NAD(P)-dependent alcohol dehydrogenase [Saccharothrix longispora]|uniref:NAD(P)-dependent alcohol dehydrogenase n=1 Tax=Saccharothrix longispora TaxID=33920 RepID=UPI0028FDBA18|nr:NAD(P)-dependent alcohol dehydrogenase [Saccharothrix longispora]MBY8848925.1 NAD(P)-dependent alcohol dehydrogenase [Saccharothrix sp. MB29]MDU0288736.1 NAD(P)-dependent alcohol dehydrogenase [Saccharothrix longispora]
MRAVLFDRYGPPEVLYEGTVPDPVVKPGHVLVRVHAASVNGGEPTARAGGLKLVLGPRFPKRTGVDFAGEVVSGPGFAPGTPVWGALPRGTFGSAAEYVAVHPRQVATAPAGLDLVRAAALPGVGTTAVTALRDKVRLRPGERLLVRGATGGVGHVAVQLGRAYGAHVTALASAANLDLARSLGADEVVDYRTDPADLGAFDVVLDMHGSDLRAYRRLLRPGGRMVAIAFRSAADVGYLLASTALGPRRARFFSGNPRADLFADLTALVEDGSVEPLVDTVHPLSGAATAHRALETGGGRGKHVLRVL